MSYDIPSISELEAIQLLNKHYAEVITSKEGGVSSAADITQTTNPITGVTRRTLYKILDDAQAEHDAQISAHEAEHDAQISAHEAEHDNQMQSFENDFDRRLAGMAFTPVGTFTEGATLTDARQILLWEVSEGGDGHYYSWSGTFPKAVTAGSSPSPIEAGSWVDRTDVTLRSDLNVVVKVFESVADMISDTSLVVGQKCRTLGYYSIGDGGANNYEIVAAATGTDDGGSYIGLSGSGYQAKGLFVEGAVNVKQFGAVGDGITDDTVRIQSTIDAVQQGTTIFFPHGIYYITSQILINTKWLKIEADGHKKTELLFNDGNYVGIKTSTLAPQSGAALFIDGLSIRSTETVSPLITLCDFDNNSPYIRIDNCIFSYANIAIKINSSYINKISNSNFSNLNRAIYSNVGGTQADFHVTGCTFGTNLIGSDPLIDVIYNSLTLINCYFETQTHTKLTIAYRTGAQKAIIDSCTFSEDNGGILIEGSVEVVLTGNYIKSTWDSSTLRCINAASGSRIVASNNRINGFGSTGATAIYSRGGITLTGNDIRSYSDGINVGSSGLSITGNVVTGATNGLIVAVGSGGVIVANNISGTITLPSGPKAAFNNGLFPDATLNDYRRGTITATLATTSGSITLNTNYNKLSYTKIGRLVFLNGELRVSSVSGPSGTTTLNLPFSVENLSPASDAVGTILTQNVGSLTSPLSVTAEAGSTSATIYNVVTGSRVAYDGSNFGATSIIWVSLTFLTDEYV